MAWFAALNSFTDASKVHWEKEPNTFKALFAAPARAVAPVKPRKSKKTEPLAPPPPPPTAA